MSKKPVHRLSPNDKKKIARDIAASDPECTWTEEALVEKLGVIQQTVNTWISDIRARQRVGRNVIIIRLNRLGWTQDQIAEIAGMTQRRVAQLKNALEKEISLGKMFGTVQFE